MTDSFSFMDSVTFLLVHISLESSTKGEFVTSRIPFIVAIHICVLFLCTTSKTFYLFYHSECNVTYNGIQIFKGFVGEINYG